MDTESLLKKLLPEPFIYVPNSGNAGDSVIESSMFQLFRSAGLKYEIEAPGSLQLKDQLIVLGGGGAIVSEDASYTNVLKDCAAKGKHVIVLPHTIKDIDNTIREYGKKITFICREQISFDYVSKFDTSAYLIDDMAFSLDKDWYGQEPSSGLMLSLAYRFLLQKIGIYNGSIRGNMFLKTLNYRRVVKKTLLKTASNKRLNVFRNDNEKTDIAIPEDNVDISAIYQLQLGDELLSRVASYMMITTIDSFEEIHTNRLHVAIVAAILGKRVLFYGNSYFKCKAVYEYSIKGKYQNVSFVEDERPSKA